MGNVHVVGPNEALVISGGCCGYKRFITGGWAWTCCLVSDIQKLTLEVFTLKPKCEKIESKQGVPINVNAIAQCKIDKSRVSTAAEMFLGKDLDYIKSVVLQTIEGHLRAITGTLTMEEIYLERQTFATLVAEMASKDLENFGISLLSFTIKEISDKVEYLTSMGRKDIAKTKHRAAVEVSTVEKDCKIKRSEAELVIKEVELKNLKDIEEQNKALKTETAKQNCEVNKKRTEAEMAYGLESAKIKQQIEKERKNVELEETSLKLTMLNNYLKQKEIDYECEIIFPAEAEAYRIEREAEAEKYKKLQIAKANSYKTKKIAETFAKTYLENGKARVELMKNRASAFKTYNDAAVLHLTLDVLPRLAAEISAPLKNIDEIVLVNNGSAANQPQLSSNFSADAARLASELPPTIRALTGLNITKALDNIINIVPGNGNHNLNISTNDILKKFPVKDNETETTKKSFVNEPKRQKSIDSISLINNPTLKSSKSLSTTGSNSVSNLSVSISKLSASKKQPSLNNTKPKSVSNLSIHTVK